MPLGNLQPLNALVDDRMYRADDVVKFGIPGVAPAMGDAEGDMWYREHFHRDEEMRLVVDGEVYYDFKGAKGEEWIRVHLVAGDLIVIPAGCSHRVGLVGEQPKALHMRRFFRAQAEEGRPLWQPVFKADSGANSDTARLG
eukprot:gene20886-64809_t